MLVRHLWYGQCIVSRTVLYVSGPMQRVTSTSTKVDETVAGLIKVLEAVDGLQLNVQRHITHVDTCNLDGWFQKIWSRTFLSEDNDHISDRYSSEAFMGYRLPSFCQCTRASDDLGFLLNNRRYRNASDLTRALKDFYSPSLVGFLLIKGVENHLGFIILLATWMKNR